LWRSVRPRVAHPAVAPGTLTSQLRQLIEQISDASKLSLDPDLDSYYLAEATARRLPALAHRLSMIGASEVGQRLSRVWPPLRQSTFLTMMGQTKVDREALDRGHAVAFRENTTLPPRLEGTLGAVWEAVDGIVAIVSASGSKDASVGMGARETYDRYVAAVGAVDRHFDAAAAALDDLLRARVHRIAVRRLVLLLVVALTVLGVAYLWMGFYAAVRRAVTSLDGVTRRMLTGEFSEPVVVEGRDELRQVVDSFNTVAGRLHTEWQRAQD